MLLWGVVYLMVEGTSLKRTDKIIEIARSWKGTPYLAQASLKGVGCDCIGLVRGVFRELYGYEPEERLDYSQDWGDSNGDESLVRVANKYLKPIPLADKGPGDVVAIRWKEDRVAKHVMILTDEGRAIHSYTRAPVTEIYLSRWWEDHTIYAFKFPEEDI